MAFGVICNTLLVAVMGVPLATASARIHIVEMFKTGVSGISHLLHRNIEWPIIFRLLVTGLMGRVTGAYVLSSLHDVVVKTFVLVNLLAIGVWLIVPGLVYTPTNCI